MSGKIKTLTFTDVDKIAGIPLLINKKPIMMTEIT